MKCTHFQGLNVSNPIPFYQVYNLVIAANDGGLKEIIDDNVNGLLFDAGNEKNLTEKINYIINNPNLIEILGAKGQKTYQDNFTEELYIKKLIEVITSVRQNYVDSSLRSE